ncbi:MAG: hypothetical protein GY761_06140 [Hyphomicrobiales bacterium]|nr:hypothetical protein [Hyphomicrobiales bacterium]
MKQSCWTDEPVFKYLRSFGNLSLLPAVVWLFVQLVMTGVFLPANASTKDTQSEAGLSNTVVICTSTGFKRITLNADGSLPQDTPDEENYCQWCMQFGKLPPLNVPLSWHALKRVLTSDISWVIDNDKCAEQNASVYFQSRAPPFKQQ